MTLYDKIKNMTVDEKAEHFCNEAICCGGGVCKTEKTCRECWLDYLNQTGGEE